jgi:hypothetical protein
MSQAEWAEAFVKAQAEMPHVPKTKSANAGSYSYTFADLGDTLDAARPVLNKHGLALAQSPTSDNGRVGVETRIYHKSGHVEVFGPLFMPAGGDARAAGSGLTYARRYSATAALGLVTEEDDDGARAQPAPQPPVEPDPADWLKDQVESLVNWSKEQSREAYKTAMKALAFDTPLSQEEADQVFRHMANAYEQEAPFETE